jgi:hypothetical protein
MTSGPKRRDAAKGDQRSPDAMDLKLAGIRVARFPGEQCGHHGRWGIAATHRGAVGDAADQLRRFSGTLSVAGPCDRRGVSDDPDFPKANHALQVLRRARFSRNDVAAIMVADLV